MKNNLKVLILSLGMLISSVGTISAVTAQTSANQNLQNILINNCNCNIQPNNQPSTIKFVLLKTEHTNKNHTIT